MSLRDRIDKGPAPAAPATLVPTVIHRCERREPEWLRRARLEREERGFVAVTDTTGKVSL